MKKNTKTKSPPRLKRHARRLFFLFLYLFISYVTPVPAQNYAMADTTIVTCEGFFWDDGLGATYSDSSYVITFQSASGKPLILNFYHFAPVQGTLTFLYFHDGPDLQSPSLGVYGEGTDAPVSIVSTGPYLTIRKHVGLPPAPPQTQDYGWRARIGCLGDPDPVHYRGIRVPVLRGLPNPFYIHRSNIAVADADNDGDPDMLIRDTLFRNDTPADTALHLTERRNAFGPWDNASPAVGDFDQDGDLDVFICGWYNGVNSSASRSTLFLQQDVDRFEPFAFPFTPASEGKSTAADWDGDGDLDIAYTGNGANGLVLRFYRNDGNLSFTNVTPPGVAGARNGSLDWADTDGDGDLDFVLSGITDGQAGGIRLGRNDGNSQFQVSTLYATTFQRLDARFFDYDNDSDRDLYVGGWYQKIYANNAGTFTPLPDSIPFPFEPASFSHFFPADYDGDGDEDALLTGADPFLLYRNDGNGLFQLVPVQGAMKGFDTEAAWADFDLDGRLDFYVQGFANQMSALFLNKGNDVFVKTEDNLSGFAESARCLAADLYGDETPEILTTGLQTVCWGAGAVESHIFEVTNNKTALNKHPVFTPAFYFPGFTEYGKTIWEWGDYNQDGWLDLLVHDLQSPFTFSKITVFRNQGNNQFTQVFQVDGAGYPFGTATWIDFDLDNDLDIFRGSGTIPAYYRNNGNNQFVFFQPTNTPLFVEGTGYFRSSVWTDLDLDGDRDLLSSWKETAYAYRNIGGGKLQQYSNNQLLLIGERLHVADFNNDGVPDCLTGPAVLDSIIDRRYAFGKMTPFPRATLADFNEDGRMDYGAPVEFNFEQMQLAVWLNQGNFFFTPDTLDLTHIFHITSDFSALDYDLDGDVDIVTSIPVECDALAFAQNVTDQARKLRVLTPNGQEQLLQNSQAVVQWSGQGLHDNAATTVSLSYSLNGGLDFVSLGDVPTGDNGGSYLWNVPNVLSKTCLIRVRSVQNDLRDQSDFYFGITDYIGLKQPENDDAGFVLYPNPASDAFWISAAQYRASVQVRVFNAWGQLVIEKNELTLPAHLDLPGLPAGLYYVQVEDGKGRATRRLCIGLRR